MGQVLDAGGSLAASALSVVIEHGRANRLHRENITQSLRIHEAESMAAMEYHRVCMTMGNEQHAREILQARLMHEEKMDLEKRIAIRENLRDEWTYLTERAGTVLIVNTLLLSVAFGILVDGPLPDSITLTQQVLVVVYFCALSSSLNLLLCSVRFAMLLRFRVGRIIVQEMKAAIQASADADQTFRGLLLYRQVNEPALVRAACDDDERQRFVQPLSSHLSTLQQASILPTLNRQPLVSELSEEPNSAFNSLPQQDAVAPSTCSRHSDDEALNTTLRCNGGRAKRSKLTTSAQRQDAACNADPSLQSPSVAESVPDQPRFESGCDLAFREAYKAVIDARQRHDRALQAKLAGLRDGLCRPWDRAAQSLFFGGCIALLVAACLLVVARWAIQKVNLPIGAVGFPGAELAAWGFLMPCVATVVFVLCVDVQQLQCQAVTRLNAVWLRCRRNCWGSGWLTNQQQHARHKRRGESQAGQRTCPVCRASIALICLSAVNLFFFMALAESRFTAKASDFQGQPQDNAAEGKPPVLSPVSVALAWGHRWPAFWEPTGATWCPRQKKILVIGGMRLLELRVDGTEAFVDKQTPVHLANSHSAVPLADICTCIESRNVQHGITSSTVFLLTSDGRLATLGLPGDASRTMTSAEDHVSANTLQGQLLWKPSALSCRSNCQTEGVNPAISRVEARLFEPELWLVKASRPWPVLVGVEVERMARSDSVGTVGFNITRRWPLEWLLTDSGLKAALTDSTLTVEGVQTYGGGLLLLLSSLPSKFPRQHFSVQQLLVGVDASGGISGWQLLAVAASDAPAASLSTRWVALTMDMQGCRLFLLAGGPRPRLASLPLPAWHIFSKRCSS